MTDLPLNEDGSVDYKVVVDLMWLAIDNSPSNPPELSINILEALHQHGKAEGLEENKRLRDLVHLLSGFLDPDSEDAHVRHALKRVQEEMKQ